MDFELHFIEQDKGLKREWLFSQLGNSSSEVSKQISWIIVSGFVQARHISSK